MQRSPTIWLVRRAEKAGSAGCSRWEWALQELRVAPGSTAPPCAGRGQSCPRQAARTQRHAPFSNFRQVCTHYLSAPSPGRSPAFGFRWENKVRWTPRTAPVTRRVLTRENDSAREGDTSLCAHLPRDFIGPAHFLLRPSTGFYDTNPRLSGLLLREIADLPPTQPNPREQETRARFVFSQASGSSTL
jgi:hypothetical protein